MVESLPCSRLPLVRKALAAISTRFGKLQKQWISRWTIASSISSTTRTSIFVVSDVIVHPSEQAFYCEWARIQPEQFHSEHTDTHTLLTLLFANRCNQYSGDLRAGIIYALEKKPSVLGPVIFAYKRLNQHMWAVPCDVRSTHLEDGLKHLCPLDSMLMDGLEATQRIFTEGKDTLPLSL